MEQLTHGFEERSKKRYELKDSTIRKVELLKERCYPECNKDEDVIDKAIEYFYKYTEIKLMKEIEAQTQRVIVGAQVERDMNSTEFASEIDSGIDFLKKALDEFRNVTHRIEENKDESV